MASIITKIKIKKTRDKFLKKMGNFQSEIKKMDSDSFLKYESFIGSALSDLGTFLGKNNLTFKDNLKLGTMLALSKGYLIFTHPSISGIAGDALNTYTELSKLMRENPSLLNNENGELEEPIFKGFMDMLASVKASFVSFKKRCNNLLKYFGKGGSSEVKKTSAVNNDNNSKEKFNPQEIKTIDGNLNFQEDGKYSYSKNRYSPVETINKIGALKKESEISQGISKDLNVAPSQSVNYT